MLLYNTKSTAHSNLYNIAEAEQLIAPETTPDKQTSSESSSKEPTEKAGAQTAPSLPSESAY